MNQSDRDLGGEKPAANQRKPFITHLLECGLAANKPRVDSKLGNLPMHQKVQLITWLLDGGLSYAKAKKRLLDVYKVETTTYALSHFYKRFCEPLRMIRQAAAEERRAKAKRADDDRPA